jgi:hypothetical protein
VSKYEGPLSRVLAHFAIRYSAFDIGTSEESTAFTTKDTKTTKNTKEPIVFVPLVTSVSFVVASSDVPIRDSAYSASRRDRPCSVSRWRTSLRLV